MEEQAEALKQELANFITNINPDFTLEKDSDTSFSRLGLDSMSHVNMTRVIKETLGIDVEPDFAFNHPTINAITIQLNKLDEGAYAVV